MLFGRDGIEAPQHFAALKVERRITSGWCHVNALQGVSDQMRKERQQSGLRVSIGGQNDPVLIQAQSAGIRVKEDGAESLVLLQYAEFEKQRVQVDCGVALSKHMLELRRHSPQLRPPENLSEVLKLLNITQRQSFCSWVAGNRAGPAYLGSIEW